MTGVNIRDLEGAMQQVRARVVEGWTLEQAIKGAANDWELNAGLVHRKVEESGWTKEGLRSTHEATKGKSIEQIVQDEIGRYLQQVDRPLGWTRIFSTSEGTFTAVGKRFWKRVYAIRHSDANWIWIDIVDVTDSDLRDLFRTWS